MLLLDLFGVFAFALSGGLVGVRRHFDIFGILTLALVTALGGGIIRDVLLGITPPRNITNLPLVSVALLAGLITFWFEGTVERLRKIVLVADAAGLGSFVVAGTLTAIHHGNPGLEAITVGLITGIGGGVMRDVMAGVVPSVFSREYYALPALFGAILVDLTVRLGLFNNTWQWGIVLVVFLVRVVSRRLHWESPTPRRPKREVEETA